MAHFLKFGETTLNIQKVTAWAFDARGATVFCADGEVVQMEGTAATALLNWSQVATRPASEAGPSSLVRLSERFGFSGRHLLRWQPGESAAVRLEFIGGLSWLVSGDELAEFSSWAGRVSDLAPVTHQPTLLGRGFIV